MWWRRRRLVPDRDGSSGRRIPLPEVIVMYATTPRTGPAGGLLPQPGPAAGEGGSPAAVASCPLPNEVSRSLEHCPQAVATARRTARRVLEAWHVTGERADAVMLVVSELVTNAVEHAQPPLVLYLHREYSGSRLWIGVSDGGPALHHGPWTTSCAPDEHGRGLHIIDALADAHGIRTHSSGNTTHWARLPTT